MVSVVKVKHDEILEGLAPRLYRSDQPDIEDGAQQRDFIWVGDVVDVMLWLHDTPAASGLFNVGTGRARSYRDLANAVCDAAGVERRIDFVAMPEALQGQYQSFTEAGIGRLRASGYAGQFTPLEEGVRRYVQDYLTQSDPYR
jgi:ADP-L-glycero-D-manno-heptose 6-epimerase